LTELSAAALTQDRKFFSWLSHRSNLETLRVPDSDALRSPLMRKLVPGNTWDFSLLHKEHVDNDR